MAGRAAYAPAPMTDGDSPPSPKPQRSASTDSMKVAALLLVVSLLAFAARYHFQGKPAVTDGVARATSQVAARLTAKHRLSWAREVSAASAKDACAGAERAVSRGLDADVSLEVLALLEVSAKRCQKLASQRGLRAEALARAGQTQPSEREASEVLKSAPRDAHALTALALSQWQRKRFSEALAQIQLALEAGRGASAYSIKGLLAYGAGQLDLAEASFRRLLELEPDDAVGTYHLALIQQRLGRYHAAREGYLKALRLDPTRSEARFNLAVLAHSIGAKDEAKHHLAKLRAMSVDAAQVAKLEALLAQPVESARPSASSANYSLALEAKTAQGVASLPSAQKARPAPAAPH